MDLDKSIESLTNLSMIFKRLYHKNNFLLRVRGYNVAEGRISLERTKKT